MPYLTSSRAIKIALIAILSFGFSQSALAEYSPVQNYPSQPPTWQGRQVNNFDVAHIQQGAVFTATSTFTATSISFPVCTQSAGASTALVTIRNANGLATTSLVSLPTLASTSARSLVGATACPTMGVTFQFALNPPFQFVSGNTYALVPSWTKGTTAPIPTYSAWGVSSTYNANYLNYYTGTGGGGSSNWVLSSTYSPVFSIQSGGSAPPPEITVELVTMTCSFLGADPCQAFSTWVNTQVGSLTNSISTLNLASTSPFSFVYDIQLLADEFSQSGTTSLKFEVSVFNRPVTLFSTASTSDYIGSGNHALLNNLLRIVIALMVITYVWARLKTLFS